MNEMARDSGSHDCSGDAAAYVLDALSPVEAAAFRRHLERCVVCRDEIAAFGEVVDVLPLTVPRHRAPSGLRRRVRRAAREEERRLRRARGNREGSQAVWWRSLPRAGALAALAVAAIVVVVAVGGGGRSPRVVQASVAGPGRAEVRLVDGRAELVVHGFAAPPAGDVYEVWLQRGESAPQPTRTLFGVTADGSADVGVVGSLKGVSRVLVTPEHAGGSPVPTHAPVIVARLV